MENINNKLEENNKDISLKEKETQVELKNQESENSVKQNSIKNRKCPVEYFMEEKNGVNKVSLKYLDDKDDSELQKKILRMTGTPNFNLADSIISSSTSALPKGMSEATKYNIVLQSLADAEPKDAHESRLTAQAAVLYTQGMDFLNRARSVIFDEETFAKDHWHAIFMKTATKLLDLHVKTIEALTHYRQRGEQKITVQHQYIQVNDGGKAIVGQAGSGGQ